MSRSLQDASLATFGMVAPSLEALISTEFYDKLNAVLSTDRRRAALFALSKRQ